MRGSNASLRAIASGAPLWVGGLAVLGVLLLLLLQGSGTAVLTIILLAAFVVMLLYNKAAAALMTIAYLMLMGDLRRLRDVTFSHPSLDLLLLVGPAVVVILAVPLILKVRIRDNLSKAILFLLVIMVLEIFNPTQGGLSIGAGGVIFFIIPLLWYWIGRQYGTPVVFERLIYGIVLPFGTAAAVLGIYQTYFGPLGYQRAWIDSDPINALLLDLGHGALRAFGFSTSATEYGTLVTMAAAASSAAWFGKYRIWAISFPVLVWAIVLGGGRGVVLRLAFTLALLWAVRKGKRLGVNTLLRLAFFLIVALGGVYIIAARFAPAEEGPSKQSSAQAAIAHQAGGLAHVGDQKYSDANLHVQIVVEGVIKGFTYPIGHGLGYTTGASTKFGGGGGSTEIDWSDMFVSLGFIGGLLYTYILFAAVRNGVRFTHTAPLTVSLPAFCIIIVSLGAWAAGGLYSIPAVAFFLVGGMSRATRVKREPVEQLQSLERKEEQYVFMNG